MGRQHKGSSTHCYHPNAPNYQKVLLNLNGSIAFAPKAVMRRKLTLLLPTLLRLGTKNVSTVALYRMAIRSRVAEQWMKPGRGYDGPFFRKMSGEKRLSTSFSAIATVRSAEELLSGYLTYFSHKKFLTGSPPDWFLNPIEGKRLILPDQHWSRIDDFNLTIGDIKTVWEASRFDWAILFARASRLTDDSRFIEALNNWIGDWSTQNPLNLGPNWKCGQEASIRLQQVLLTAYLLDQYRTPLFPLVRFVVEHCRRIVATIRYAMAQDNNHGTSEAAALFVAGAWLTSTCKNPDIRHQGEVWQATGRRWLEDRLARLVADDGSFSQHSINYHRVMVDTLNLVEFWRRELAQDQFSIEFYRKAQATVEWLYQMTDPLSGDAPNIGANDGARLFVLSETDYRDYRPTVQLGAILFADGRVYPDGPWDEPLLWLNLQPGPLRRKDLTTKTSRHFRDGGYVLLRPGSPQEGLTWGLLRYPHFRFRPGHADALHFDLWHRGINVLRDSGSYSYNTAEPWQSYFSSATAHNTIQFDDRNQMPRLSRFLHGDWLRMERVEEIQQEPGGGLSWSGSYKDHWGCRHRRTIHSEQRHWRITDEIDGFKEKATLRWRLAPGEWRMNGLSCLGEQTEIKVSCNRALRRYGLQTGWESRYYLNKTELPVLEAEVSPGKAILTTEIIVKG